MDITTCLRSSRRSSGNILLRSSASRAPRRTRRRSAATCWMWPARWGWSAARMRRTTSTSASPPRKGMERPRGASSCRRTSTWCPRRTTTRSSTSPKDPIRRLRRRRLGHGRRHDARGRQRYRCGGDSGRAGGRYVGARSAGSARLPPPRRPASAGAFGLKKGLLKGDILLNLDSETEGELYVGCAGGLDANITLPLRARTDSRTQLYGGDRSRSRGSRAAIRASRSSASAPMPTRCCSAF